YFYVGQIGTWTSGGPEANPAYRYEFGQFLVDYMGIVGGVARAGDGLWLGAVNWKSAVLWCPSSTRALPPNNTGTVYTNYAHMPSNLSSLNWFGWPGRTFSDYTLVTKRIDSVIDGDGGRVQFPAGQFYGKAVLMMDACFKYSPLTQSLSTTSP